MWKDYIALLPVDWSFFPLFYTDEDLELLKGSDLVGFTIANRKKLQQDYNLIAKALPGFETQYTATEFAKTFKVV